MSKQVQSAYRAIQLNNMHRKEKKYTLKQIKHWGFHYFGIPKDSELWDKL